MGNCAGYCISENPDNKRKITVEQKDGEFQPNAYINEQRQEVEIEYGHNGENRHFGGVNKMGQSMGYEPNDKINMGPSAMAGGSTYTGER